MALIEKVEDKGWDLSLLSGSGQITNRGLFGTPEDVLDVLIVEHQPE